MVSSLYTDEDVLHIMVKDRPQQLRASSYRVNSAVYVHVSIVQHLSIVFVCRLARNWRAGYRELTKFSAYICALCIPAAKTMSMLLLWDIQLTS